MTHQRDEQHTAPDAVGPIDSDESKQNDGPVSAPMVAALEQPWAAIRARHPEVPAAVLVLGAGSIGAGGLRLGHFAAMRWHHDDQQLPEVFIGGEGLNRGRPTCRPPCYTKPPTPWPTYAESKTPAVMDAGTTPGSKPWPPRSGSRSPKTRASAGPRPSCPRRAETPTPDTITALGTALRMHRTAKTTGGRTTKTKTPPPCVCDCGRRIRVAPTVLAAGPITCGMCGTDFAPEEDES